MTLVVIAILSFRTDIAGAVSQEYHLLQIVPYILVLFGGIAGINVFVVLIIGILSGTVIMLATGNTAPYDLLTNMEVERQACLKPVWSQCLWQPCVL